jgi:hypothetical protein
MVLAPGTPVRLPDGREGMVIPTPVTAPRGLVLVKVKKGRKSWFKVDECTPAFSNSI